MMAVELSEESIDRLFVKFAGKDTTLETDFEKRTFTFKSDDDSEICAFQISGFDSALVEEGD
jgi:hypothetical protein